VNYYGEFWTDNVRLYRILLESGWAEDHIHVLYGEGHDETAWPCEHYRETMVDFAPTSRTSRPLHLDEGRQRVPRDPAGHLRGFHLPVHVRPRQLVRLVLRLLCLMDGCMADKEFASYFNAIPYKHRAVDMQQCNSGGFIGELENATTVISTAANCTESAWEANESDPCGSYATYYGE